MKQLLTDIQNRLQAAVPALKYIDEDWGQMDYFMPNAPVKFPCALINIGSVNYSNEGKGVQLGMATVVITVADIKLSNTSSQAPVLQKQAAWKVFETIGAVHAALHGWNGSAFYGPLTRTTVTRRKNDDGINLFDIVFTTMIRDDSALKGRQRHSPVTIEIQGPEILL
ncbi:MAG: hypothetical protein ABS44_21705 [Chryseobacterium sp. SCN 40-13]|nr:MAG: hypothetical protein ABS44_21705 [Chryseobacterium sp. SCN 40-13]